MSRKLIFGKKAVLDAINNQTIKTIFCTKDHYGIFSNIDNIQIKYVQKNFFSNFNKINHQYIAGEMISYHKYDNENLNEFISNINVNKKTSLIVALDEIQDPGNFGAICRTCESFGIDGIIYKKNNQVQVNETVIKTSVGAVNNLNMLRVSNLWNSLEKLKNNEGYWILSSSLSDKSIELNKFKTKFEKMILVVGNEDKGVSKNIQDKSDINLKIKMIGKSQSLNVSVATGVILHYLINI